MEMNGHKTVEKDELTGDRLLSDHEYDNIRELDNNLPKWVRQQVSCLLTTY